MALLPQNQDSQTVKAIYALRQVQREKRPGRLNVSVMSHPCKRYAWMSFRWIGEAWTDPATGLPFPVGTADELTLINELKAVVAELHSDPSQMVVTSHGGHVFGFMHAAAIGLPEAPKTWHGVIIQFYSRQLFEEVKSRGCAKSDNASYVLAQYLMKQSGMERVMLLGQCIDNDVIFSERIHADRDFGTMLDARLKETIEAGSPPAAIGGPDHPDCQVCVYKIHCHQSYVPVPTCRSCVHASPEVVDSNQVGTWGCGKHKRALTGLEQESGCDDHLFIPLTIGGAKMVQAGEDPAGDWVQYEKPDGTAFVNSKQHGGYKSRELYEIPWALVGNPVAGELKDKLGAQVTLAEPAQSPPHWIWVHHRGADEESLKNLGIKLGVWEDETDSTTLHHAPNSGFFRNCIIPTASWAVFESFWMTRCIWGEEGGEFPPSAEVNVERRKAWASKMAANYGKAVGA